MRKALALALLSVVSIRCASIVHGTTQRIPIGSTPAGADVSIACIGGVVQAPSKTPTTVELRRKEASCVVSIAMEGRETAKVALARNMSGWYIANILIGGVIGLIVDAADGAMFTLSPDSVHVTLKEIGGALVDPATPPRQASPRPAAQPAQAPPLGATTARVAHSVDDVKDCMYFGVAPADPPCLEKASAAQCAAWHGLQLGGNTILPTAGGKFLIYRCPDLTPK